MFQYRICSLFIASSCAFLIFLTFYLESYRTSYSIDKSKVSKQKFLRLLEQRNRNTNINGYNGNIFNINVDYNYNYSNDYNRTFSRFLQEISKFSFISLYNALNSKLISKFNQDLYLILKVLSRYIIKEPLIPINKSCVPPPLLNQSDINCSAYQFAFNGKKHKSPVRVAHLIQFGFDVDVLEIQLRELHDVVDYIFIIESTRTHLFQNRKILAWEQVRNQERFEIFSAKVVHLTLDDVESMPDNSKNIWDLERRQEKRRWERFLIWNLKTNYFHDDDIVGFGDTDEIASRHTIHLLKHCQVSGPVDIGIWFIFGTINSAFKTDHPVKGNEYTLGDPTFWPLRNAKEYRGVPSRMRGKSGKYLLGGMHMTSYPYLPFLIIKFLTCTECNLLMNLWKDVDKLIKHGTIYELETYFAKLQQQMFLKRITTIDKVELKLKHARVLPWFYSCNQDRYGYWEKKHDTRLD